MDSALSPMPAAQPASAVWIVPDRNYDAESVLQRELGVRALLASVLVRRGLTDPEQASTFLQPKLSQLHSPKLLPDYEPAVREILGAKERNELIFIHGDYDADGVSSTALFSRFLTKIGCRVHTHVPHREKEGYGIHSSMVQEAKHLGAKLFLTCDCGISAHEQVEMALEAGMRVVVTDHHTVGSSLPRAQAIVNPHRADSEYPFDELSGAGVVLKLCAGIAEELELPLESFYKAYLDLAVLGTVADVVPLRGENRIIAKFGLEQLKQSKKPGLRALMQESGLADRMQNGLRAWDIGFVLGPRINAAGRIDDASLALRLLLSQDQEESAELARTLEGLNQRRKLEQQDIVQQAIDQVERTGQAQNPVLFVWSDGWHPGLVGIVAGKLVETYHRPAFVGTIDPATGTLKGSARSIDGFHLADAIRAFPDLMGGGGHAKAAGFSGMVERVEEIQQALLAAGAARLDEEALKKRYHADVEAPIADLDFLSVMELRKMEPFGEENREPLVAVREVPIVEVRQTRNPDHPQLIIRGSGGESIRAPAFGLGKRLSGQAGGFSADLLINPGIDEWQGSQRLQWMVRDFEINLA